MRLWIGRIRLILAMAGLVFAVVGIATENHKVVWAAIGLLGTSFAIRLILNRRASEPSDSL